MTPGDGLQPVAGALVVVRKRRSASTSEERHQHDVVDHAPDADRVDHEELQDHEVGREGEPDHGERDDQRARELGVPDHEASAAIQNASPSTAIGIPASTAYFESCTVSQPPPIVQIERFGLVVDVGEVGGERDAGDRDEREADPDDPVAHRPSASSRMALNDSPS